MKAPRTIFKLTEPIQAHGEEVDTLQLRNPNAGDLAASGAPFTITNMDALAAAAEANTPIIPEFSWNYQAMLGLISRIADIPRSAAATISWGDLFRLQTELQGFFTTQLAKSAETATSSSSSSSPQTDGSTSASSLPSSGEATPPISLRSVGRN